MDIERAVEFIATSQANAVVQMEEIRQAQARGDVQMEELRASQLKTEETLRRAIRLAVREARNERQKRRERDSRFDEKITQVAAAHLLTEEALRNTGPDPFSIPPPERIDTCLRCNFQRWCHPAGVPVAV